MPDLFLLFLFGTIMGSFVNAGIVRLYEHSTILGRSRCPACRTTLRPHHLVPILSWLWLGGRCAFCRARIHIQYPLVELTVGMLMMVTYARHPFFVAPDQVGTFLVESALLLGLLVLVVFDLRWKVLPLEAMMAAALVFAGWNFFRGELSWMSLGIGMMVGWAFLAVQVLLSRGAWMGSGDPWMGLLIGAALGWPRVGVALYLAYIVGGTFVVFLWVLGVVKRGSRIPFAPILATGTVLALWFGSWVEAWFRTFFT